MQTHSLVYLHSIGVDLEVSANGTMVVENEGSVYLCVTLNTTRTSPAEIMRNVEISILTEPPGKWSS